MCDVKYSEKTTEYIAAAVVAAAATSQLRIATDNGRINAATTGKQTNLHRHTHTSPRGAVHGALLQ